MTADVSPGRRDRLVEEAAAVSTRAEFVSFVRALAEDFHSDGGQWENGSLDSFLQALARWAEICGGYYHNHGIEIDPDEPQWRVFGEMLLAATVYE